MMMIDERRELLSLYSDMHKDAHGFRPRDWSRLNEMTVEELRAELDRLETAVVATIERERERELDAVQVLAIAAEALATDQGVDVETAYRWLMQAEGCENDLDHFLWRMGIGCGIVAHELKQELRKMGIE